MNLLCNACKMQSFATIVHGYKSLTIAVKLSILDVCEGPGFASDLMTSKISTVSRNWKELYEMDQLRENRINRLDTGGKLTYIRRSVDVQDIYWTSYVR